MSRLLQKLKEKELLVSDGAWGTFLFEKGLKTGECPEKWNMINPEAVLEIAQSYIDAGSDIISTNSFGASRVKLRQYNLEDYTIEINISAARISREAAGNDNLVFGSIGPTGKFLITGEIIVDELYQSFIEQSEALAKGGVDAILLETFYDLEEANTAIDAIKNSTHLDVICSFTYDRQPDNSYKTLMGNTPSEITGALLNTGIEVIGSNCGSGFENMLGIAKEIRTANNYIPLLIQANAGLPSIQGDKITYNETPEFISPYINELISCGVNIIGGCCGTTPEHIKTIRQIIDEINK
jgi:5-methyltetrahydrofolate--homocysteine methyltransferase